MKLVAVSQRIEIKLERSETRDVLDQNLIRFLSIAGFLGIPIPNTLVSESLEGDKPEFQLAQLLKTLNPSAVVLSGGNDIGEYPERDLTETILLDYAETQKLPLLGICRGMQMICHREGISTELIKGHAGTRHILTGEICKEVNSYHDYGITICPKNYKILAVSDDSRIEAISNNLLPWEGWMWHPERENPFEKTDIRRVKNLFDS